MNETLITVQSVLQKIHLFSSIKYLILDHLRVDDVGTVFPKDQEWISNLILLSFAGCSLNPAPILSSMQEWRIMYLDISNTQRSESNTSFYTAENLFPNLRIAKLRGLRLTSLPAFVLKTQLSLWSLDVIDNFLTDAAIDALLSSAFALPAIPRKGKVSSVHEVSDSALFEESPPYQRIIHLPGDTEINSLRPDSAEEFMRYIEAHTNETGELDDDQPMLKATGLTHLYMENNKLTSNGAQRLLKEQNRLQHLEIGSVRSLSSERNQKLVRYNQPATPIPKKIQQLKVHHSFITNVPTFCQGRIEEGYVYQQNYNEEQNQEIESYGPLQNFTLSHLTLSGIPTTSTPHLTQRLTTLLRKLAKQQSTLLSATRELRKAGANHRRPRLLSGLTTLRLEFIHPARTSALDRSLTGDASTSIDSDTANFHEESANDFSFFDFDSPVQSPISRTTTGTSFASRTRSSTVDNGKGKSGESGKGKDREKDDEILDVIEELKKFRKTEIPRWEGKLEIVVPPRL